MKGICTTASLHIVEITRFTGDFQRVVIMLIPEITSCCMYIYNPEQVAGEAAASTKAPGPFSSYLIPVCNYLLTNLFYLTRSRRATYSTSVAAAS